MSYSLRTLFRAILPLVLISTSIPAQQPAKPPLQTDPTLSRIEFVGLKRFNKERLLQASGLELGQPVNEEVLDAAAQKLMDSGLVHKLTYRLQAKDKQASVVFQIEEGHGGESTVIFDNFIWFTEDELGDAVRREAPTFQGTAPTAGQMTDAISRGLQQLLKQRKIAGTVEYLPSEGIDRTKIEHVFRVKGVRLPICTIHFPGAHHVEEDRLVKRSQELIGTDYSRSFANMFAFSNLFPIYRELGHLRASFGRAEAVPLSTCDFKDGIELTMPVEEGSIYVWDRSEWSSNKVLPSDELDKLLDMKSGEIANGIKFDQGIAATLHAYGRKGYLEASIRPDPAFDDAARKVIYRLDVKEGPQYHMGELIIKGFSDNLGNYLRGRWEMKREDVYDQGYAEEFFKNEFKEILRKVNVERQESGKAPPKTINTLARPNRETLTVDVTFELAD
jgi:outer membrane protein assembly factor BamA